MSEPRFLPPKGKSELHMAITAGGHSCVVYGTDPADGKKGTVIPERFRKIAIGEGCGIVGIDDGDDQEGGEQSKDALIIAAITAVMERQAPDELDAQGAAKLAAVKKQAGFNVTKVQLDAAWAKYVDGLGDDESDSDDGEG